MLEPTLTSRPSQRFSTRSTGLLLMRAYNLGQLLHPKLVRVVAQRARLAGTRYGAALVLVIQVVGNQFGAFLWRAIGDDLLADFEELVQVVFLIRQEERPDARRLEEAHVVGEPTGHINVAGHTDSGFSENAVHLKPPSFASTGSTDKRVRRQGFGAVTPEVDSTLGGDVLEQSVPVCVTGRISSDKDDGAPGLYIP